MLTQDPQITPNTFLHTPQTSKPSSSPPTTIFFITGNPGLIGYYHTFLSLLSSNLISVSESRKDGSSFQVYGRSLAGFDIGDAQSGPSGGCHDLEEQICFMQRSLGEIVKTSKSNGNGNEGTEKPKPRVILIGHSLGAYIAMEILRRHREKRKDNDNDNDDVDFDIVGGIMLFPTVVDIAKSPAGVRMTRLLSLIPHLALIASYLATVLTLLIPDTLLWYLVKGFMNSPPDAVVDTTVGFLKSQYGVRQAIHLGADEMRTITSDKWADDIWGTGTGTASTTTTNPPAKLFFYFGQNDHWVAEQTRDEIIEVRGRTQGGPKMFVCEDGVPHAFCLRDNDVMAKKVGGMIGDILDA